MHIGLFEQPNHPPGRDVRAAVEWDLAMVRWADEFGFTEAWIGEHFTARWEPIPAPDLLLAQALTETSRIRLGPGGHCLPYHHPAELAHRVALFDHLSGGRMNLGIAASGVPTDWQLFGVDGFGGEHRRMTQEALDMILRLWSDDEPFRMEGEFWTIDAPPTSDLWGRHLKPLQQPHPPIAVAGLSPKSDTLRFAGTRGYLPMSLNVGVDYLVSHWSAYEQGAASAERDADRSTWRVLKEVLVAESDAEAIARAREGGLRRYTDEFMLPLLREIGVVDAVKVDSSHSDAEVDFEYLLRHQYLVGSPQTVAEKLAALHDATGGFGTLLLQTVDHLEQPEVWRASMELLGTEVQRLVAGL